MSNDTHSGNLLRSNLSGYILDQIDVNRKRFFDLKSAARDKTITRNRLFLEKDTENTYKKKLSQIEDTNKNSIKIKELNDQILNLRGQLTDKVDEIKKKEDQIVTLNNRLDKFTHSVLDNTSSPKQVVPPVSPQPPQLTEVKQPPQLTEEQIKQIINRVVTEMTEEVNKKLGEIPNTHDILEQVNKKLGEIPNTEDIAQQVNRKLGPRLLTVEAIANEVVNNRLRPIIEALPDHIADKVQLRLQNQIIALQAEVHGLGDKLVLQIPKIEQIRDVLKDMLPPQFVNIEEIKSAIDAIPQAPDREQIEQIINNTLRPELNLQKQIVNEIQRTITTQGATQQAFQMLQQNIMATIARDIGYIKGAIHSQDIRNQSRENLEEKEEEVVNDSSDEETTYSDYSESEEDNAIQGLRDDIQNQTEIIDRISEEIQNLTNEIGQNVKKVLQEVLDDQQNLSPEEITTLVIQEINKVIPSALRVQTNEIRKFFEDQNEFNVSKLEDIQKNIKDYIKNKLNGGIATIKSDVTILIDTIKDKIPTMDNISEAIDRVITASIDNLQENIRQQIEEFNTTNNNRHLKEIRELRKELENIGQNRVDFHKAIMKKLGELSTENTTNTTNTDQKIEALKKEIGEMKTEIKEDFKEKFAILESKLTSLVNSTETKHIEMKTSRNNHHIIIKTSISELERRIDEYNKIQEDLKISFNGQIADIKKSNSAIELQNVKLSKAIEEIQLLKTQTGETEKRYKESLVELREIKVNLNKNIEEFRQKIREMGDSISELKTMGEQYKQNLDDMRSGIAEFLKQIGAIQSNVPSESELSSQISSFSISSDSDSDDYTSDFGSEEVNQILKPTTNPDEVINALQQMRNQLEELSKKIKTTNDGITTFTKEMEIIKGIVTENKDLNTEIKKIVKKNSTNIQTIMNKLNIGNSEELIVNENINIRQDIDETIDEIIGKIIDNPNSISSDEIDNLGNYSEGLAHLIARYTVLMNNEKQYSHEKLADCMRQNKELKKQLDDCQKELNKCLENEKNGNLTTDNKELVKKLEDLRADCKVQIEDLSKELKKCQEENQSLKKDLQDCKNPIHEDKVNIGEDQDYSLNIDSQIIGVPPESDLLHMLLKKYKTFANLDDLPENPSQEELEKLKKDYIKHIDNVTDALMIKLNILKMLIFYITDARELAHAMALLADLENLINGKENSNSLEENKKMRLNTLKIAREAHKSSKNMINGLNKHKEIMEKGIQQREKYGGKYEITYHPTDRFVARKITSSIGGRTIGDELYEDIGFINSEIIKLPAQKNNFKQKKINRIVNNLFNNINKKKTKVKNSVIRVQKGGVSLGNIRTMRDKYFDFVRLDKILEKIIREMKKKYDQYQIFKENEDYEASKEPMTPEYKQAKTKRSISIGELKNYYTIMKSIINVWEKIGLWEDKIFSKPTQENKDLFNEILSELNEIYNEKESETRMRDIRDNLVKDNNERFNYLSEIGNINLDIEKNFDEKNDSVNKGRFSGIFPYIETDEQIDEEIIEKGIKVGDRKILRWKAILKLSLKIYKEAYIPMIKWSNCLELVTQDDTIPSTFIIPLTVVESFDTWNKKYTKIEEPWEDKKFFSTVYTKQKEVVSEFPYFIYLTLLLDKWQILTRKPISLFARINDMGRSKVPTKLAEMNRSKMYNRPDVSERDKRNNPKQSFDESQESCLKFRDKNLFDTEQEAAWTLAHQEVSLKNSPTQKYANRYKNQFGINQEEFDPTLSMDFLEDHKICDKVLPYDYIQWYETDPKITNGQESGYLAIDIKQCEKIGKDEDEDVELKIIANPGKMVKFQEVFWRPEFDNNKNISSYMLLDKLIPNRIGTYLVTYGYSGVGKSYTLFGADKSEGLLQATVGNISTNNTFVGLKLRVYELYGMGMCYSDCWNNYNSIDQVVYHYNIDPSIGAVSDRLALSLADSPKIISRRGKQIPQYIKGIHKYATEPEFNVEGNSYKYFTNFPSDRKSRTTVLQNFTKFIKNIEADRKNPSNKYPKRVNETVNNPDSSRAKLVYDFLFEFENKYTNKNGNVIKKQYECPLIIDDTPGAENLLESYILKNTDIMFFDKISDKKQKKIEISEDSTESDYCMINNTGPGENYIKWQECLLNSILLNPLFCGIFNSAGILTAFNILLNGEGVYDLDDPKEENAYYKYVYPQERYSKSIYKEKVRRTSELFTEFYNFLKGQTIEDINLTKYVDMYDKGFKFKLLEARQESYSKQYSGTYENKVFSNFFDTKTFKDEYKTARDNVLKDTSQIRPIFLDLEISAEQIQQQKNEIYQDFKNIADKIATYKDKNDKYKGKGVRVKEGHAILVNTNNIEGHPDSEWEIVIKKAKEYKIDIKSEEMKILNFFTKPAQEILKTKIKKVKLVKKRKNVDTKEIEEKTMRLAVWLILKLIVFCSEREENLNTNEMKYDLLISLLSYSADVTGIFWIKKLMGERKMDDTNKSLSCRSIYESFDKNTQDSLIEKFNHILKESSQDSDNNFGSLEELYKDYWNSLRIHTTLDKIKKEDISKYWKYKDKERRVGWGKPPSKKYYNSKYSFEIIKKHLPIPTKEIRNKLIKDIKSGGAGEGNRPDNFFAPTLQINATRVKGQKIGKTTKPPTKDKKTHNYLKKTKKMTGRERRAAEKKLAQEEADRKEKERKDKIKEEKTARKKYLTNFINFLKDYAEDEKKKKKHPGKLSIKDVVDSKGFWEEILFDLKKGEKEENFKSRFTSESLKNRCLDEIMSLNDKFFTDKRFKYYSREVFKRYITLSMESWYINQNISGILKKCSEISGLDYSAITGGNVDNNDKVTPWQYKYASQENIGKLIYKDKNFQLEKIPSSTDETICKMYNLSINTTDINKTSYVGNLKTIEEYIDKIKKGDYNNMHSNVTNYLQGLYKPEPLFPIKKFPQEIEDSNKQVIIDNEIGDKENLKNKDLKKWQKKKIDTAIGVLMDPYVNKPDDSKINISDYKMFYVFSNNDTQLKCYDQLKTFGQFSKFISNMPK
jgi:chromosome segregation ATPase